MDVARVEKRTDLKQRIPDRPVRPAGKRSRTSVGDIESKHAPHRRALARPIRAKKASDATRYCIKTQVVDRSNVAEFLGDVPNLNHAASVGPLA
jgi:hypothetical protein